jgi:hypothetical protein
VGAADRACDPAPAAFDSPGLPPPIDFLATRTSSVSPPVPGGSFGVPAYLRAAGRRGGSSRG